MRLPSLACVLTLLTSFAAAQCPAGGLPPPPPPSPPGGSYGGPGDVVTGPSGPRTPRPAGPTSPRPKSPTTPGPAGPTTPGPSPFTGPRGPATRGPAPAAAAPASTPRTPRGIPIGPDYTQWNRWWEYNKAPFLRVKEGLAVNSTTVDSDEFYLGLGSGSTDAKDSLRPSDRDVVERILPPLKRALDSSDDREIAAAAMLAMAKTRRAAFLSGNEEVRVLDVLKEGLGNSDQRVREMAALSMGLSRDVAAVDTLISIVHDTAEGRAAAGRDNLNDRTRAFAAYGLGLIGNATDEDYQKWRILKGLTEELSRRGTYSRDLKIALVHGIGLIETGDDGRNGLAKASLEALSATYDMKESDPVVQAHCAPAIARILDGSGDDAWWQEAREQWKGRFLDELKGRTKARRADNNMVRSAALSLGQLCDAVDSPSDPDIRYEKALVDYYKNGKDQQARYFSLMALGQMGGRQARNDLLLLLGRGSRSIEQPWAALALGVLEFNRLSQTEGKPTPDAEVGRTLLACLNDVKNPAARGAFAVATGLAGWRDAGQTMRDLLVENRNKEQLAGYLCIGLALLKDRRYVDDIRATVDGALRRPQLLSQGAMALGSLGDREAADHLQKLMTNGRPNLAKMSALAAGLAAIGDRRSIDPLVKILSDEGHTDFTRSFAASALGGIADRDRLPWNSQLSANVNYRAAVETLTNAATGILDLL